MAEPIIIKGGSLSIEFEDAFNGGTGVGKKSFTHNKDATLNRLVITRNGGKDDPPITLSKRDIITIYYDAP